MRTGLLLLVSFVLASLPQPAAAAPVIGIEEQALVVSGVTPNGRVVWFGVAKETEGYMARFVRRDEVLADEDGDGGVRWELDRTVPLQSIWVAVDLASGEVAVATPPGYPLRDASAEPGKGRGEPGRPEWVESGRGVLELLVVRPGQGAWGMTLGDGGEADDDGRGDGRITAALARLRGVGDSPGPPERFQARDLVFAVDLDRMELLTERIPAGHQP